MTGRRRLAAGIVVIAATAVATFTGCAPMFNRIADTVLANEVRYDDREAPRTAYAIPASADGVQLAGGQGSGLSCSLPPGAQLLAFGHSAATAPIALQMRQACAFHDYCYRHGNATYGYSQADCDFMLQQQAFRLCKFINRQASISTCETDARKVTLGVRLGGYGSFRRARALDRREASTFLEFDPYPVRATSYKVVRIADAPRAWVRDGALPKAAWHFDIRPSGSLVHVLGWKADGSMLCTSLTLAASYHAMNGPPMVVRDSPGGEDWFVWWQRGQLSATHGRLALLPPGRAGAQDWAVLGAKLAAPSLVAHCGMAPWPALQAGQDSTPPLAFVTGNIEPEVSELHPASGTGAPGLLRLMGLSTHSCKDGDRSPCIVDMVIDTARRHFQVPGSLVRYRAMEPDCADGTSGKGDGCNRYRNFVGAPIVVAHPTHPSLVWTRRGTDNGDGYRKLAHVQRFAIGATPADPATNLGELSLTGFPETMEPAFLLDAAASHPKFLSIAAERDTFKLVTHTAVAIGQQSVVTEYTCFQRPEASWLQRPPAMVTDRLNPRRHYLVFSRVRLNPVTAGASFVPGAALEVAVATLDDGGCQGVRKADYPAFYGDFAAKAELKAAAAAGGGPAQATAALEGAAHEAAGRYAERVGGGQMVLADVTGDAVPDLLQVASVQDEQRLRVAVLVGKVDATGLQFTAMGKAPP